MGSEVYFTDFNVKFGDSILNKFERFLKKCGIDEIDFTDKYVAVKIHFGEWGNVAFIRHQYAAVLCEHIKKLGGKPFLTDANTLYVGMRGNAVDHLNCAAKNGYSILSTGVPIIIADGLRGTDERVIPVEGAEYAKEPKIGAAIAEADILISVTHCKGHMEAGYGGVLKNIGMGSGSKKGKMEMHSKGTPSIDKGLCIGCGGCVKNCANDGVRVENGKAVINGDKCLGCGYCFAYCPKGAIRSRYDEARPVLNKKIAEYTKAAIGDKPAFHIAFASDIQVECDCNGAHGAQLVPDVGIFAGKDPVAVDQACVDAINKMPVMLGGPIENHAHDEVKEVFLLAHPETDYAAGLDHAVKLGLGTREYELIKI